MSKSFSWILWPYHEYLTITSDEFIVEQFRFQLQGNSLTVEVEQSEGEGLHAQARQLAERYIKWLGDYLGSPLRLKTIEEFKSMPPRMVTVTSPDHKETERIYRAIRKARNELLASGNPMLSQCYDYLQDAREHKGESLFNLYKFIETIEHRFQGERNAIRCLKLGKELKFIKRLANEPVRDERHAPQRPDVVQCPSAANRTHAMEYARSVLRSYEQYLRRI